MVGKSIVAVPLASGLGIRNALVVAGGAVPLATLLSLPRLKRAQARWEACRLKLQPTVELFSRLGIFEGASRQALEWLAGNIDEQHVAPGTSVVQEGEPADAFYVIRHGTLAVMTRAPSEESPTLVTHLRDGDYFGEIGLLEHIPRTATVRAESDAELLRIKGDDFIAAVNEPAALSGALINSVSRRLARTHPAYRPRAAVDAGVDRTPA